MRFKVEKLVMLYTSKLIAFLRCVILFQLSSLGGIIVSWRWYLPTWRAAVVAAVTHNLRATLRGCIFSSAGARSFVALRGGNQLVKTRGHDPPLPPVSHPPAPLS